MRGEQRRWVGMLLGLLVLATPSHAFLDLVTRTGLVFRTTTGTAWTLLSTLPYPHPVGYSTQSADFWILSQEGILQHSATQGTTWTAVTALPAGDFVAFAEDPVAGYAYALTRSGTFWRGVDPPSMQPLQVLPASDMVDLAFPQVLLPFLYALTASGDVYLSMDHGTSWVLRGNTGFPENRAIVLVEDTVWVITHQGDLLRSTDTGRTWVWWAALSQVGVVDLHVDHTGQMFVALNTSELWAYIRISRGWDGVGTPSQTGVVRIATGGTVTFEQEHPTRPDQRVRLRVLPGGRLLIEGLAVGTPYRIVDASGRLRKQGVMTTPSSVIPLKGARGVLFLVTPVEKVPVVYLR